MDCSAILPFFRASVFAEPAFRDVSGQPARFPLFGFRENQKFFGHTTPRFAVRGCLGPSALFFATSLFHPPTPFFLFRFPDYEAWPHSFTRSQPDLFAG